jgi:hypothetical protein
MKETNIEWTCVNPKCHKQFRLFADDGADDSCICWNWCPHCGAQNNVWIRFVKDRELAVIPIGIGSKAAWIKFGGGE